MELRAKSKAMFTGSKKETNIFGKRAYLMESVLKASASTDVQ